MSCITAPAPRVLIRVPMPTGPPSSQPSSKTTAHSKISTAPMGIFFMRRPRPSSSESLGPQPWAQAI